MKIAFIGGSWSSNIGNAFYNLGTQALLSSIQGIETYFIPDPPQWKQEVTNDFDLIGNLDVDLVILTGPCLNLKLEKIYSKSFANLLARQVKIGFISAGMSLYDEGEAKSVISFLKQYNPSFIFTRDSDTYNFFNRLEHTTVYDGLCTSMFLNNAVDVAPLALNDYYVFNFDGHKEPYIELNNQGQYVISQGQRNYQQTLNKSPIIRTDNRAITEGYRVIYSRPNVYHSDLPQGYLSIFKHAKIVFSERVHTCASTIILGGTAQFVPLAKRSFERRSRLFERIRLPEIFEKPSQLNFEYIEQEKDKMINALDKVLANL